mgnify:CR=1 FL=1
MKRIMALILACVMIFTSVVCVSANEVEIDIQSGLSVEFNGESLGCTSIVHNYTHYVPMRKVCEKMGASVFYRASDRQALILSRNGDMIRHIVEGNIIVVNDQEIVFQNPSIIANNETYVPLDMVMAVFYPDEIYCDNALINIKKELVTTDYHKVIEDVLGVSKSEIFYPEYFNKYISYHATMPSYGMQDVIFRVNVGLDSPFYQNIKTITYPHELLVIVNKYNKLPDNFQQYNLVGMNRAYTVNDGKQYLLLDIVNEKYMQMADAAKTAGLSMKVVSAYRTESYQAGLYNNKLRATGRVNADNYSARPGHSEHQTGLAVDINSTSGSFEYTAEFKWLKQHAHEYGFILRYPKGKEWITGYAYEPWHYRYVGVDVATVIYEEDITYEEYYAKYILAGQY